MFQLRYFTFDYGLR